MKGDTKGSNWGGLG